MTPRSLRLNDEQWCQLLEVCKRDGIANPSVFVRQAIEEKLGRHRTDAITKLEERIAGTLNRMRTEFNGEIAAVERSHQVLLAELDTFVKTFLVHIPEPVNWSQAKADAETRYEKFRSAVTKAYIGTQQNGKGNHHNATSV